MLKAMVNLICDEDDDDEGNGNGNGKEEGE